MYRSIYNHTSTVPGALSLEVGEQLLFIEQHDANWWKMQAENGAVGLVPSSYLKPDEQEMQDPDSKNVVLESIERAMEVIHSQAAMNAGQYTAEQRANLKKLIDHRKGVIRNVKQVSSSLHTVADVSPSPDVSPSASIGHVDLSNSSSPSFGYMDFRGSSASHAGSWTLDKAAVEDIPIQPRRSAPALPGSVSRKSSKRTAPKAPSRSPLEDTAVPANFASSLIEQLRIRTGISYDLSFIAAETVISHIMDQIPITAHLMDRVLHDIMEEKENDSHSDENLISTHDGQQIETILEALTEHKDDAQQRSWALDMDEPAITHQLMDLMTLLADASHSVSRAVIRQDEYQYLQSLVMYFQMEHRTSLRLLLLKVFGSLCGVDKGVISQLLCSVLPGELSQAIESNKDDLQLTLRSCLVLTMIFSTGESVPYLLHDHLNEEFVKYLIDQVESSPEGEDGDNIISGFVRLLLAYNQHFTDPSDNIVMKALAGRGTAKIVSEQIMLFFNREEDPVQMFDYPKSCSSSVFKVLVDLFSSPKTSGLFFTADMKVLIEIILRQITDFSAGVKARTDYLILLRLIITNSDYSSHRHKCADLGVCLKRIREEEEPDAQQDKYIVQELLTEFPQYFS